ncbi:MAG: MBOAT family protein [Lachnospiraceae bacterium]|nr:MBOAT family protein [Lachnospiraceae bacterium]
MVFSSVIFLFYFLPAAVFFYYITPARFKNITLLLLSLFFYWWGQPYYLVLLISSIFCNWLFGVLIGKSTSGKTETVLLSAGICMNIILLGVFKYTDFLITAVNQIADREIPLFHIILPVGISFFTFQGMSYIIDIYKGTCKACKNPLDTALYIALFPQLIAGPIVKYNEIYPQLHSRSHSFILFSDGIKRFVIGLSKKVLISNVLAITADDIFDSFWGGIDTPTAWIGIICYTMQIYFDFSGYSDMAIGLGKMFGFSFSENFNYPYISKSITEFWRRWHISLSTWFRDYVYIPLGGSRRGIRAVNLFIVFLVTGIWHGASYNFIVWGVWYGVLLIIEKPLLGTSLYRRIPSFIKWTVTMLLVIIGWVIFRSPDLPSAAEYMKTMFAINSPSPTDVHFSYMYYIDRRLIFTVFAAFLFSMPIWKNLYGKFMKTADTDTGNAKQTIAGILEIPVIIILFIICIIFIINNVYNPFIYFQF